MISEINPNPNVYVIPKNYKGANENIEESGVINGFPQISWANDVFNTWLAQNTQFIELAREQESFNYIQNVGKTGVNMVGNMFGMMSGDSNTMASSFSNFINSGLDMANYDKNHEFFIKGQMAEQEYHSKLPNNASMGNSNATLLGYNKFNKNIFTRFSIKRQFAERIDKFFDMYGYLTNTVKLPNLNNRPNWNYIKTIGLNVIADIPQLDLQEIKYMFDNGITLWHNTATFLDYSQNNR